MQSRIEAEMSWESTIGENIMYNCMTPLEAVLNLCIDDGVPGRGHRTNIFKDTYYYTAPTINVPQTVAAYTGYAAWDDPSPCASSDTPASENAKSTMASALVMVMALVASVIG